MKIHPHFYLFDINPYKTIPNFKNPFVCYRLRSWFKSNWFIAWLSKVCPLIRTLRYWKEYKYERDEPKRLRDAEATLLKKVRSNPITKDLL